MYELLYLSRAVVDLDPTEMETFLGSSRIRNAQAGITGMLLHIQDATTGSVFFVQLLEGPDPDLVERTYERISKDELHTDIKVLHRGQRDQRTFGNWSMLAGATSAEAALRQITGNVAAESTSAETTWDLLQDSRIARSLLIISAGQQETTEEQAPPA